MWVRGIGTMIRLLALVVFALLATRAVAAEIDRFYVSPLGRDTWSGRVSWPKTDGSDGPFATITRARDAVREFKRGGLKRPVEVEVGNGTYYLKEPIVFTAEDSGTASCPITYRGQMKVGQAIAIISGGVKIDGWHSDEQGVWEAGVPEAVGGKWNPRTLRVGLDWAVRARHPNFDPKNPTTGGWLFADWHGDSWERGLFGTGVASFHNAGDSLEWKLRVPAAGTYRVWLRYGSMMKAHGVDDMGGRYTLRAGEAEPVPLMELPDTGSWSPTKWTHSADIALPQGETVLKMTNTQGGGINLDAIALTEDPAWNPDEAITDFSWWGAYKLKPPAEGKRLLIVQAEACDKAQGKEISVPDTTPPGSVECLRFKPGDIPEWKDISGAEVHMFPAWGWVSGTEPVGGIDRSQNKITLATRAAQDVRMGNRYFIENVREALDAPNEWFLDTRDGRLTYIQADKVFRSDDVVASKLDRLIVLDGGKGYVEHLRFEELTFMDTDYTLTKDYYTPDDAAIRMSRARDCVVSKCFFHHLGGYALHLDQDSQRIEFTENTVQDLGQGGVIMRGDNSNHPHHNLIAGNIMRRLGLIYKHVAGVYLVTGSDNRIAHNTMSDLTRYGVALKTFDAGSSSHRNVVEFNDIRRSNLETNDTGAIETLGRDQQNTGNVIRHNRVLDVVGIGTTPRGKIITPYFNWGIYLDDYSSGTTVYGNIVGRTANGAINVHGGKDNTFENNIFLDAEGEQIRLQPRDEFMKGNRFSRNIVAWSKPESPMVYRWSNGSDWFSEWDYNLYWLRDADLTKPEKLTPNGAFDKWRAAGNDAHSLIADPLFADPAKDNYDLRPDSPAFGLGFKRIPVEKIGHAYWRSKH